MAEVPIYLADGESALAAAARAPTTRNETKAHILYTCSQELKPKFTVYFKTAYVTPSVTD